VTDWSPLKRELAKWQENGRVASLWLRDDDAEAATPALDGLLEITAAHGVAVLLGIIPARAAATLGERLLGLGHVEPAVHGVSHFNHAGQGEKKAELGDERPADMVLAELGAARERMARLFPALSGILVPPWNRIARAVAERIGEAGFTAISTFGWRPLAPGVRQLNTHVDLVDWKSTARLREIDEAIAHLAGALATSREHHGFAPVGVLSHHLRGNGETKRMLDRFFDGTARQSALRWASAGELLKTRA
jgi:hypothetical protein